GSYWAGAALANLIAVVLLSTALLPADVGWRVGFGLGALLGLGVMYVRKGVPESPRWLFIHGYQDQAEEIVGDVEDEIRESTGQQLAETEDSLTIRQRRSIPFTEIAKVAFKMYPKRSILGVALFVGQAFMYNGITFDLGTLLTTFFDRSSGTVPYLIAIWAASNF